MHNILFKPVMRLVEENLLKGRLHKMFQHFDILNINKFPHTLNHLLEGLFFTLSTLHIFEVPFQDIMCM